MDSSLNCHAGFCERALATEVTCCAQFRSLMPGTDKTIQRRLQCHERFARRAAGPPTLAFCSKIVEEFAEGTRQRGAAQQAPERKRTKA